MRSKPPQYYGFYLESRWRCPKTEYIKDGPEALRIIKRYILKSLSSGQESTSDAGPMKKTLPPVAADRQPPIRKVRILDYRL